VLYGGSYGATAAQVYLARHGTRVAAAVLDGATLLDVPIWERMPRATQGSFDKVAARCRAEQACRSRFPDPAADLRTTMVRLRSVPVRVSIGETTVPFGADDAQDALRTMLREPASAVRVPLVLRRAASGDLDPLTDHWAAAGDGGPENARKLMYWAIRCSEGWSRARPEAIRKAAAGTQFLESALENAKQQALVCPLLGKSLPAPDTGRVPHSRVPVLFLVGDVDPQDPYANVAHARRSLPDSHILVVPGGGHGSVQLGCLPEVARRFLAGRRLTAADRACARSVRLPPFATRP
jgi:pimeloyl-ACP methyl ester carboxylesterase